MPQLLLFVFIVEAKIMLIILTFIVILEFLL